MKNLECKLISITTIKDTDGQLCVAETKNQIPFEIKRIFTIQNVPSNAIRGNHANRKSQFVYICLKGSITVVTDTGEQKREFKLQDCDKALYLPTLTWMQIKDFSEEAILLVLASEPYEKKDYCDTYKEFLKEIQYEIK